MAQPQRALSGVRVVEIASFISGPYAGMMLSELGAEVVKVEVPPGGDPFRGWGTAVTRPQFHAFNRGKRSVAVDWRRHRGWFETLVAGADVLLMNFRPDTQAKLGLTYDRLRAVNQRLIVCNVSGFGAQGAYAQLPCYDAVAQAMSGLMSLLTRTDAPESVGPPFADGIAGLFACIGVLAALCERARTGRGQSVDLSMIGTLIAFLPEAFTTTLWEGQHQGMDSRATRSQSYALVASDGLALVIHLSSPAKFWTQLLVAIERPELAADPRFEDKRARVLHFGELHGILAEVFRRHPRDHWLERLRRLGVPCGPLYTLEEAAADPEIAALALTTDAGGRRHVRFPLNMSDSPEVPTTPAPEMGEANADFGVPADEG